MAQTARVLAGCAAAAIVAVGVAWRVTRYGNEVEAAAPAIVAAGASDAPRAAELVLAVAPERVEEPLRVPVESLVLQPAASPVRARVLVRGQLQDSRGLAAEIDLRVRPTWPDDAAMVRLFRSQVQAAQAPRPRPLGQLATGITSTTFSTQVELVAQLDDHADPEGTLALAATHDGWVEGDITPFFASTRALPQFLWLEVRHKNFEPRRYLVPNTLDGRAIDAAALAREGDIVLEFDITLVPRCVVHGQAYARNGETRTIRIEAWLLDRGRPAGLHASTEIASADDVYELALAPDRRYAIVALCDGLSPLTTVAYTFGGLDLWLAPFVLDGGVTIAGRIDLGEHLFGVETWLYLTPDTQHDPRDRFGLSELIWTGSSFQPESRGAQAASDGSFAFDGLVPGRYRLRVGLDREWWTEMDPVFVVTAPSSALALQPPLARVTLQLEQEQQPFARRDLRIRGAGRCSGCVSPTLTTDGLGQTTVWLLPGEPYIVEVPMGGRDDWKYGKVAPWNHREFVELISMSSTL